MLDNGRMIRENEFVSWRGAGERTGMSRGAEAPTAPKDQERKACGS